MRMELRADKHFQVERHKIAVTLFMTRIGRYFHRSGATSCPEEASASRRSSTGTITPWSCPLPECSSPCTSLVTSSTSVTRRSACSSPKKLLVPSTSAARQIHMIYCRRSVCLSILNYFQAATVGITEVTSAGGVRRRTPTTQLRKPVSAMTSRRAKSVRS